MPVPHDSESVPGGFPGQTLLRRRPWKAVFPGRHGQM